MVIQVKINALGYFHAPPPGFFISFMLIGRSYQNFSRKVDKFWSWQVINCFNLIVGYQNRHNGWQKYLILLTSILKYDFVETLLKRQTLPGGEDQDEAH
jgi:hypothetical protein